MKRFSLFFMVFMSIITAASAEIYFTPPPADWAPESTLSWTIFDVNEGDCMLLSSDGESMMVDGGPQPFRRQLEEALKERGLTHMKYYLSTHFHDDHIRGLYYMFAFGLTCDEYLHPYTDHGVSSFEDMKKTVRAAKNNGVPDRRLVEGDTLTLGGAEIQVLRCTTVDNQNAQSLVLKVSFKDASILLCGDIIGLAQRDFVKRIKDGRLDADLIKMPHHALTPAVNDFLDAVSPKVAIITNTPARLEQSAINQLKRYKIPAFYSGSGTVFTITDGTDWYIYQTEGDF